MKNIYKCSKLVLSFIVVLSFLLTLHVAAGATILFFPNNVTLGSFQGQNISRNVSISFNITGTSPDVNTTTLFNVTARFHDNFGNVFNSSTINRTMSDIGGLPFVIRFDTTTLADGNYTLNITAIANSTAGATVNTTSNVSEVRVDNTGPSITILNPGAASFLKSGAINFTFGINDASAPIANCSLNLDQTNSTGGYRLTNFSIITNNTQISLVNDTLLEGTHTFNLLCTDYSPYLNNTAGTSNVTLTIDLTSPITSITLLDKALNPQTTFGASDAIKIQCARSDIGGSQYNETKIAIKRPSDSIMSVLKVENIIDALQNILEFDLDFGDTQEVGDYQVSCTGIDRAGNINNTNVTFTVQTKAPPKTSGFSVPGFAGPVGKVKISEGTTKDAGALTEAPSSWLMSPGSSIQFSVKGQTHTVTTKEATSDSVTLTIQSSVKEVTIKKGESKVVDVDDDGTGDIEITYHKLFKKTADITFKVTSAPPSPVEEGGETGTTPQGSQPEESIPPMKKSTAGVWITLLVIVIIVVVGYIVIKGKKK